MAGVKKLLKNHTDIYPGTNIPAYIRKYALVNDLKHPTSWEAWEMVLTEMCKAGGIYGKPNIKNEMVQKAVLSVGWKDICNGNPDFVRAHFIKAYEGLVKRESDKIFEGEEKN